MTEDFTITVQRFHPGEKAPSWLIDFEPVDGNSIPGVIVFQTECDVIELADYYMVVPTGWGVLPNPIHFTGIGCKIFAPSKLVRFSTSLASFKTLESGQPFVPIEAGGSILRPAPVNPAPGILESDGQGGWRRIVPQHPPRSIFDAQQRSEGFASGAAEADMKTPEMQQLMHLHNERLKLRKSLWTRIKAVFRP